jgi:hypothetical protein
VAGDFVCAPAHDPEKHVLDLIGDGNRFSDKIMRINTPRQIPLAAPCIAPIFCFAELTGR